MSRVQSLCIAALCIIAASAVAGSAPPLPPAIRKLYEDIHFSGVVRVRAGASDHVMAADEFGSVKNGSVARFPIGSNTKLHVALSLYQLQELGLVNLSASVADYLTASDFAAFGWPNTTTLYCPQTSTTAPNACEVITFEQLLGMSAGIPGGAFNDFFAPYAGSIGATVGPYLLTPLYFVPGTNFFYSNPSFMLAAYFVEKFSGMQLRDYVQKHIWELADMHSTSYDPYNEQLLIDPNQVAERYHYVENQSKVTLGRGKCSYELDPGVVNGAGGFVSTVDDESNLYFKLFNFSDPTTMGQPFLQKPQSLLDMVRPRTYTGSPRWFAQGVWSMHCKDEKNWTRPYPCFIFYEGETICSHTANFFDVSVTPPLLTQAWKNEAVFLPTADQFAIALSNRSGGTFVSIVSNWNTPPPLHEVAWATHNHWAPAPPTT